MKLALRELRRRPGRFVTATVILTLVAVLVMFLGGLLDGLIRGSHRSPAGPGRPTSSCTPTSQYVVRPQPDRRRTRARRRGRRPGVAARAASASCSSARGSRATAHATWPRRHCSATSWRPSACPTHQRPARSTPTTCCAPTASRSGWRSCSARLASPVTVIGFVTDVSYSGQGTLWAAPDTWRDVLAANRPDVQLPDDVFQALVVRADADADPPSSPRRSTSDTGGATESLTITAGDRRDPRRRAAALDVQPDHRGHRRHRGRRRRAVLRAAHRRAARPLRGAQGDRGAQPHAVRRPRRCRPSSSPPSRRSSPEGSRCCSTR